MRTLAIDLGARRVGLAISDEGGMLALPLEVIQNPGPAALAKQLADLARREGVARFVIGIPLNMDDTAGSGAKDAKNFGQLLEKESGLEVIGVDERLSSFEADEQMSRKRRGGEKLTHGRKKQLRDAVAAAVILQRFLDQQEHH